MIEDEFNNWLESDEIRQLVEKHGSATLIPNDPDLTGATIGQVFLIVRGIPGHTPELLDSLSMAANAVAVKLGSLRYHHRRYVEHLYHRLRKIESDSHLASMIRSGTRICEREMLYEVDAFFHQFKSVLDMLVKILFEVNPCLRQGVKHRFFDKAVARTRLAAGSQSPSATASDYTPLREND